MWVAFQAQCWDGRKTLDVGRVVSKKGEVQAQRRLQPSALVSSWTSRARSPTEGGPQVLRQGRSLQGLHATVSHSSSLCIKLCPLCSL